MRLWVLVKKDDKKVIARCIGSYEEAHYCFDKTMSIINKENKEKYEIIAANGFDLRERWEK